MKERMEYGREHEHESSEEDLTPHYRNMELAATSRDEFRNPDKENWSRQEVDHEEEFPRTRAEEEFDQLLREMQHVATEQGDFRSLEELAPILRGMQIMARGQEDFPIPDQQDRVEGGVDHHAEFAADEGDRANYGNKFGHLRKTRGKIRGEDWAPKYSKALHTPIFVPLGDQQG